MYLSAERLALANQTVWETFQRTSVACQAIPYWETGDPGQSSVRSDSVQFFFPAACRDQNQLYHGTQVNNQVPPL